MQSFGLTSGNAPLRILSLGAHSDDLEIGCGATLQGLLSSHPGSEICWVVFCAGGVRGEEAAASAEAFLGTGVKKRIHLKTFRDGFLPYQGGEVKEFFEELKRTFQPDLIFTQYRDDRHQDHRIVSDLAWNTWRDHTILEYEVPKYDGDLGIPNFFVPFGEKELNAKVEHCMKWFSSQRSKKWFTPETFRGMARLRGIECASEGGFAEAFYCRKMLFPVFGVAR